jgi:glycosyltransferase involved in cell wall biosynthesis
VNILLINHYAGSKHHGMEYRPYYLAREWVRTGHNVTIIAASFSHLRTRSLELRNAYAIEDIEGVRYIWLKTPAYQGNGSGRVINMLSFLRQLYFRYGVITENVKPDVVIASSTYPLDIFPAYRYAQKAGAKLIFEVHDLWPLSPIELGGMSKWHPFAAVMQIAENFYCRHSDRIISILPNTAAYLAEHGMEMSKFFHVPNGVDIEEWESFDEGLPEVHARTLQEKRESGDFLVGYAGAHGLANSLDSIIEAAKVLVDHPVKFVLVGQGPEKAALQQKTRFLRLENVTFLPPVQKSAVRFLLSDMDCLFIGWRRRSLYRFGVSPNKLMDYMMAGKPVIHAIEAGNDMVAESGCGVTVPPEDPEAIIRAVEQLRRMTPLERERMGAKGKEFVLLHHDYRVLARRFLDVMA